MTRRQNDDHLRRVRQRLQLTFIYATEETAKSIRFGSPITNAAGQPVLTGNLLQSWIDEFISRSVWKMTATGLSSSGDEVGYARIVEDNVRGVTFRNHGAHSVRDTALGWPAITKFALKKAKQDV